MGNDVRGIPWRMDRSRLRAVGPLSFWIWLWRTRNGYLAIWSLVAVSALVLVLWAHVFGPVQGILNASTARVIFIGGTSLLVLPLLLFFLNSKDNLQQGPSLALPLLSLGVLATLTALAIADSAWERGALLGSGSTASTPAELAARVVFFIFLAVAFIPNAWNAAIFAEFEEQTRGA